LMFTKLRFVTAKNSIFRMPQKLCFCLISEPFEIRDFVMPAKLKVLWP
jgi:hypothetical protein